MNFEQNKPSHCELLWFFMIASVNLLRQLGVLIAKALLVLALHRGCCSHPRLDALERHRGRAVACGEPDWPGTEAQPQVRQQLRLNSQAICQMSFRSQATAGCLCKYLRAVPLFSQAIGQHPSITAMAIICSMPNPNNT